MATFYVIPKDEDLQHYGILGMKWGIRRYQNADGSLTTAGKRRYLKDAKKAYLRGDLKSYVRKTISKNDIKNKELIKNTWNKFNEDNIKYNKERDKLDIESKTNKTAKEILNNIKYYDTIRDAIHEVELNNNKELKKQSDDYYNEVAKDIIKILRHDYKEDFKNMSDEDIKKTKPFDEYMEYELVEGRLYKKEQELISKASVAGILTKKYSDLIKAEKQLDKSWNNYFSATEAEAQRIVEELSNKKINEKDWKFAMELENEIYYLIDDSLKED